MGEGGKGRGGREGGRQGGREAGRQGGREAGTGRRPVRSSAKHDLRRTITLFWKMIMLFYFMFVFLDCSEK